MWRFREMGFLSLQLAIWRAECRLGLLAVSLMFWRHNLKLITQLPSQLIHLVLEWADHRLNFLVDVRYVKTDQTANTTLTRLLQLHFHIKLQFLHWNLYLTQLLDNLLQFLLFGNWCIMNAKQRLAFCYTLIFFLSFEIEQIIEVSLLNDERLKLCLILRNCILESMYFILCFLL